MKSTYTKLNELIDKIAGFEDIKRVNVHIDFQDKRIWSSDITNPTSKSKNKQEGEKQ